MNLYPLLLSTQTQRPNEIMVQRAFVLIRKWIRYGICILFNGIEYILLALKRTHVNNNFFEKKKKTIWKSYLMPP